MDTKTENRPTKEEVEALVTKGLAVIKGHMPETYKDIQARAALIGNKAYQLVRHGLGGKANCFWAMEAGYIVGTPFTSATNAWNSASSAATSATNAGNSATAAGTSATNAANSAAAAAASAAVINLTAPGPIGGTTPNVVSAKQTTANNTYTFNGVNWNFKAAGTTGNSYFATVDGAGYLTAQAYYAGANNWQLDAGKTAASGISLGIDGSVSIWRASGSSGALVAATQTAVFDSVGNLGVAKVPDAWGTTWKALQVGAGVALTGESASVARLSANSYISSGGIDTYRATTYASQYLQNAGAHTFYTAPSGTAGNAITFAVLMQTNSPATTSGANAAASVLSLNKDTTTSRSINAAGTINASGADYAEYEANNGLSIAKGAVVGFKADGTLTGTFAEAIRFAVKSTNPSLVGGDVWGNEDAIGAPPVVPAFTPPEYSGNQHPGQAPAEPAAPAEDAEPEQLEAYAQTLQAFDTSHAAYTQALHFYTMDQAEHAARVEVAQSLFDTATWPEYERSKAVFDAALEAARQRVDRIAYSGKVPCNVLGATPGGYIVAAADASGKIIGRFVQEPDFAQYKKAVGRVNRILADGRCEIAVMVH